LFRRSIAAVVRTRHLAHTIRGITVVDRPTISVEFLGRFHAHGLPNKWKMPSIYRHFCTKPRRTRRSGRPAVFFFLASRARGYGLGMPHCGPSDTGVSVHRSQRQGAGEPSNHRRCARSLFCSVGLIPNSSMALLMAVSSSGASMRPMRASWRSADRRRARPLQSRRRRARSARWSGQIAKIKGCRAGDVGVVQSLHRSLLIVEAIRHRG
jgi:hypothetical protein